MQPYGKRPRMNLLGVPADVARLRLNAVFPGPLAKFGSKPFFLVPLECDANGKFPFIEIDDERTVPFVYENVLDVLWMNSLLGKNESIFRKGEETIPP